MTVIHEPIYFLYFQKTILCRLNNKEWKHLLDHGTLDGGLRTLLVLPYRTALNYTKVKLNKICSFRTICKNSEISILIASHLSGVFKGGSYPSHFFFEINVGKGRIRHRTTLNKRHDFEAIEEWVIIQNSESFFVGSDSFRQWFQKWIGSGNSRLEYPLIQCLDKICST